MELKLGPEIILSYKRLAYTHWYALAEFIDNSTQAYFNNKELLDKTFRERGEKLTVKIDYHAVGGNEYLEIRDNSVGMSEKELQNGVIVGKPPDITSGRSKYGIGLKTAACWFGDSWTIVTTKLGDDTEHFVQVNVPKIAAHELDLHHKERKVESEEHYTIVKIESLHRTFYGRTVGKIKNYLRSMYRLDMKEYDLQLFWQQDQLTWDYEIQIYSRLIKDGNGDPIIREFKFPIGEKKVSGWAGVFEKGSRSDAGFSIIQANRVINGWPSSYRPTLLFGPQEGGRNDLVNQRLVGELCFEGFDVSHTKDTILFTDNEEDELDEKLREECGDLRSRALTFRKQTADERSASDVMNDGAITEFESELKSEEIKDFLSLFEIPAEKLIKESNNTLKESIITSIPPSIEVRINELQVSLYVVGDISLNDPYVIIESTRSKFHVIVIVNKNHPHWVHLQSQESILNFLRHCTYDGVAEWKAYLKTGKLDPDTVKLIKDNLLRLPFEIEKHNS